MATPLKVASPSVKKIPPPPPFSIIKNPLAEDLFHAKLPGLGKGGYYQQALKQLAEAKRGSVMRFPTIKPYGQLRNAAKKLGYQLMFAKDDEALLVQIVDTGSDN